MLHFPQAYTTDPQAELLIEENMNALLLEIISFAMDEFYDFYDDEISFDDWPSPTEYVEAHQDEFGEFLEEMYDLPRESAYRTYAGLYCLLRSGKKHIPSISMEKLLANMIVAANEVNADMKGTFARKFSKEERAVVMAALKKDREEEYSPAERKDTPTPSQKIKTFEQPEEWLEICFWDEDYAFMDDSKEVAWENEKEQKNRIPLKWWEDEYSRLNADGVDKDVFEEYGGY